MEAGSLVSDRAGQSGVEEGRGAAKKYQINTWFDLCTYLLMRVQGVVSGSWL